jgi:phosphoribosylformylglycinamidine (FGAM) synthase-like amidotransferase family enzyme
MYLPIAHAEGKFVPRNTDVLRRLENKGQLPLRYAEASKNGKQRQGNGDAMLPFPINPNGSIANVAGVCDETGRVFGLMPHPERYIDRTHHPRWTRNEGSDPGEGLAVFRNAVAYFGEC